MGRGTSLCLSRARASRTRTYIHTCIRSRATHFPGAADRNSEQRVVDLSRVLAGERGKTVLKAAREPLDVEILVERSPSIRV